MNKQSIKKLKQEFAKQLSQRVEVLKETDDDWHGSYVYPDWYKGVQNQGFVKVSFHGNIAVPGNDPMWRVSAWGNDDLGMDIDFKTEAEATEMFLTVISLNKVNKQQLRDLGFNFA